MNIERIDADTYNVKSETNPDKEYMVYNSINEGFLCDCMDFIMKLPDEGVKMTYECKHIKAVKKKRGIH